MVENWDPAWRTPSTSGSHGPPGSTKAKTSTKDLEKLYNLSIKAKNCVTF